MFGRVGKRCPDFIGVIFLGQSTGRANDGTLSAGDTGNVIQLQAEGNVDVRVDTTKVGADDADILLITGSDAATAKDTFVVVSYQMSGSGIQLIDRFESAERILVYAIFKAELLQFAVRGTRAAQALFVMGGKNEFQGRLAGFLDFGGVGLDLHAFRYGIDTGGDQAAGLSRFDDTDTAGADLVLFFHKAQGRDLDSCSAGSLKDCGALRYADSNTVNFYIYHFHSFQGPFLTFC